MPAQLVLASSEWLQGEGGEVAVRVAGRDLRLYFVQLALNKYLLLEWVQGEGGEVAVRVAGRDLRFVVCIACVGYIFCYMNRCRERVVRWPCAWLGETCGLHSALWPVFNTNCAVWVGV